MSEQHTYKGFVFTDETSATEDGRFRACIRILGLVNGRKSQRFIDLESFANEIDARKRALSAAVSWIDSEQGQDELALPSSFVPFAVTK